MEIFAAADRGDDVAVLEFIEREPDLSKVKDAEGATALHHAGTPFIVRTLVEHGADIDGVDDVHCGTPLQWAISHGRSAVVESLLGLGAEVDFWSACALDDVEKLKLFLYTSPDLVNELSSERNALRFGYRAYPLQFAARYGGAKALRLLISHGADVMARSSDGSLAIHDAAFTGFVDAVKVLVESGTPIDDRDLTYGMTALGTAEYASRIEVVAYVKAICGLD